MSSKITHLLLYSTSHCHLCEEAEALLIKLSQKLALSSHSLGWNRIEISDDDTLLAQYGIRIPVLKRVDTNAELGWPFTAEDVTQFIAD